MYSLTTMNMSSYMNLKQTINHLAEVVVRNDARRDYFEKLVESVIPMRKEQTPEDIGKLAAFLSSDDAHNITGQAINVDGGRRMN